MMSPTTLSGRQTLAGDYRDADVRWAQARRARATTNTAVAGAPAQDAAAHGAAHLPPATGFARLATLLSHAR